MSSMLVLALVGYAIGVLLMQGATNPSAWGAVSVLAAVVYAVWLVGSGKDDAF